MLNASFFNLKRPANICANEQEELKRKQDLIRSKIDSKLREEGGFNLSFHRTPAEPKFIEQRARSDPGIIIKVSSDDSDETSQPECKFCKASICTCPDKKKKWLVQMQYEKNDRVLMRFAELENNPVNVRFFLYQANAKRFILEKKYDHVILCITALSKFRVSRKRRIKIEKLLKRLFNDSGTTMSGCKDVKVISQVFEALYAYDPFLSDEWLTMRLYHVRIHYLATQNKHKLEIDLEELYEMYSKRTINDSSRAKGWYTSLALEYELMGFLSPHLEKSFRKCKGVEKLLEYQPSKVRAHIAEVSAFVLWKDQSNLEKCRTLFYDAYKLYSKGGNIKAALCCMTYSVAMYNIIAKKRESDGSAASLMNYVNAAVIEDALSMMEDNKQVVSNQTEITLATKHRIQEIVRSDTVVRKIRETFSGLGCVHFFFDIGIIFVPLIVKEEEEV